MRWLLVLSLAACTQPGRTEFEEFTRKYKKEYASKVEEERRFGVFTETLKRIKELNAVNGEPVFGVTFVADRTPEEKYMRGRKGQGDTRFLDTPVVELVQSKPAAIDWRRTKAVTAVKNQGQCGSCWAFSTAEEVESQYTLHVSGGYSEDFSPQQVTSCVTGSMGCGGGDTVTAYQYLQGSPGLAQAEFWPYAQGLTPLDTCMDPSCTQACSSHNLTQLKAYQFYIGPYASVKGFRYATPPCTGGCENQDVATLAASVAEAGPVSVCVNAGAWDDYVGGVLTAEACGGMGDMDLDHCVQLVGYNTTAEKPYWIVRNSWDTGWGLDGFIHLEFGKNTCGLADEATIVLLEADERVPASTARLAYERMYSQATGGLKPELLVSLV